MVFSFPLIRYSIQSCQRINLRFQTGKGVKAISIVQILRPGAFAADNEMVDGAAVARLYEKKS